jgi:hypothetical protein
VQYLHMDADERQLLLNQMAVEGEVADLYEGLEEGDDVVFIEDMYDIPPQD